MGPTFFVQKPEGRRPPTLRTRKPEDSRNIKLELKEIGLGERGLNSSDLGSRDSDWLRTGRPRGRSSRPDRVKNYLHVVQTDSGVHPASYPTGTGDSSPGE
jgi:hypothetical protein